MLARARGAGCRLPERRSPDRTVRVCNADRSPIRAGVETIVYRSGRRPVPRRGDALRRWGLLASVPIWRSVLRRDGAAGGGHSDSGPAGEWGSGMVAAWCGGGFLSGSRAFGSFGRRGAYYVDKTPWIGRLADEGAHYFLSRPRRFGKSLLLDTIKELFEGNEPLFRGLAVHDAWDWSTRHAVVRLSFGAGHFADAEQVRRSVLEQLAGFESAAGLDPAFDTAENRFHGLLEGLHRQTGRRVVVLVDEYDKPILDALRTPDAARASRDFLRGLYGVIKDADEHIRISLLAGASKFSKVSLFSGLNNLVDLTMDPPCATICGYTEEDLDTVFAPELVGLDREAIRRWYNGYRWATGEAVYNPFGVPQLFRSRRFGPWWFETGSPRFLVERLLERRIASPRLDRMTASEELLSAFDVEAIGTEALLFQTGYLTVHGEEEVGNRVRYRLGYPNLEVRQSLNEHLLRAFDPDPARVEANRTRLHEVLMADDLAGLEDLFRAFFAGIPYQWFTKNDIANYEGYYASVFYSYFAGFGADVTVEDSTNLGRLDMAVRYGGRVYLFEFKVVEQSGGKSAMAQLMEKRYADKYRGGGEPIHLIGVEFSSRTRGIVAFETRAG